ncbi:MAG: protein jag [Candidatus Abyssobacteria bacterium SURF_17]|uniref:RNA-binding protein KhpB n=1 Tax=Candidatus Abyssobacteria bacterium SURF_17 TaxID=2093361 RepID=A0A419F873_9BACT|nr:MAG: protein jag [Candidatus Abyssubacteria bacterium SURF_17]
MVSIEVEGKTPEEAIQKALEVLDAPREKVKVEILEEGSKGLFGMIGSKQAKVKATLLEITEPDVGRSQASEFSPRPTVSATKPPRPITDARALAALGDTPGKETLEELLRLMGFKAEITQRLDGDKIILSVHAGEDSNILIGRRGKNLNGLQYVVNRICARKNENTQPVVIDIEGYRERREEALEALAQRLAAKAKSSHREVETEPLSAAERRLIHMALKDDAEVRTQSRGEGPYKNVVIRPRSR